MKSMNRNRIVAILATISLLVGSLAVGGVLTASAVTDGWYGSTTVSTVTKGQFKHFARYTASTADVVEGTSLILGMVPTGSPYNGSPIWQHYNDTTGNISNLTDGVIGTSSDTAEYTILRDGNTSTKRYLYFNLGGVYEISDFIVASSQYHGGPYGAKNVNIYVANTDTLHASRTGAFTVGAEDNDYSLVYSNWGFNVSQGGPTVGNTSQNNSTWTNALNFHIQPEDGATVTGQYVCFEISCSVANYGNYFSELAVYGKKSLSWNDATVGQYTTYDRFTQLGAIMGEATSLIAGKTAYGSNYTNDGDTVSNWYHESGSFLGGFAGHEGGATDGKIAASVDDCATAEQVFRSSDTTTVRYFYYDLGATYDISDFVVASTQSTDTSAVLKNINIYVAEEWKETAAMTAHKGAFTEGNFTHVFGYSNASSTAYIHRIRPTDGETVRARYVCFALVSPQKAGTTWPIPLSELAVYGTEYVAPIEWNDMETGRHLTYDRFTQLDAIMGEATSLIANKVAYGSDYFNDGTALFADGDISNWYNEGTLGDNENISGDASYVKMNGGYAGYEGGATDGKIAASTADCATTEQVFRSNATGTSRYFFYDLGATYDISDFLVASTQSTDTNAVLKNIRIYVAENWSIGNRFTYTKARTHALDTDGAPIGFTKVYENWGSNTAYSCRIQPTDGAIVTARYVCFEFTSPQKSGTTYPIPVGELAVYGEKVEATKALGGQVSSYVNNNTVAKLRLGFNVAVTGITRNDSYEGDYTAAKVTVNGTAYDIAIDEETGLPIIGALVARGAKATEEDLTIGSANAEVKDVHAKKIYEVNDDNVTFTALITNVPSDYFDEQIIGRAYVGYKDGDTVRYVYSDLLSRSVDDVTTNTGMQ